VSLSTYCAARGSISNLPLRVLSKKLRSCLGVRDQKTTTPYSNNKISP